MYILGYCILAFLLLMLEVLRKKESKIDFLSIFNINFLLFYLLPCVLWVTIPQAYAANLPYELSYNAASTPEVFFAIFIAYFGFVLPYIIFFNVKPRLYVAATLIVHHRAAYRRGMMIMLSFACLVVLAVVVLGGLESYFQASLEARHNHSGFGVIGYFRYFYSAFPAILIFVLAILTHRKLFEVGLIDFIALVAVSVIGLMALIVNGGRGELVGVMVSSLLFLYMTEKLRFSIKSMFWLLLLFYLSLFIVFNLHSVSSSLIRGEGVDILSRIIEFNDNILLALLKVFQYSAHTLFIIVEIFHKPEVYNYPRLWSDNISAFLMLIPGGDVVDMGFYELPDDISKEVMGKENGSIPPGWIGWSLLNGGYLLLFFKAGYSAFFTVLLDKSKKFMLRSSGYALGSYIYFISMLVMFELFFAPNSSNMIRGGVGLYVFFLLVLVVPSFRVARITLLKAPASRGL